MAFASLAFAQDSQIPQPVLDNKTRKDLSALLAWSSAVSLPPALVDFVKQYKIYRPSDLTPVTLMAIQAAHDKRKEGNKFYFRNSETVVHPLGGGHHFDEKGVTVTIPNQKPTTYVSESGFPIKDPRPYSGGVIALVCSTLCISNGRLEYVFQRKDWIKVFPITHAAFNPKGLPFVMHVLERILRDNDEYRKMKSEGTGLKGPQLWDFLGNVINTCRPEDYIDLHDTIVKYFLQAIEFTMRRGKQARTIGAVQLGKYITRLDKDQQDQRIVTDKTVGTWPEELPDEWARPVEKFQRVFGHRPFLLIGSIPQTHRWIAPEDGTYNESEAHEAYTTRRSIGSGGSNGPGVALECDGFSSGASTTSNRCVLLLTMVLNVIHHDKDAKSVTLIDIRASVNDVAYLERSLPLVCPRHNKRVKYLVDRYVFEGMSVQLKEMCVLHPRPDAHLIAWHDVDVASVPKNGSVTVTMNDQWKQMISCFPAKQYSIMLPILSRRAFTQTPGASIFRFRKPADFQGIFSTYKEFFLMGELDAPVPVVKYLEKVTKFSEWLQMVVQANSAYTTWFLAPRAIHSPLSNLIRGIAKGAPMVFREGSWEPVLYNDVKWSGDTVQVPKIRRPVREVDPDGEESDVEVASTTDEDSERSDTYSGDLQEIDEEILKKKPRASSVSKAPTSYLEGNVKQPEPSKTAPPSVPGTPVSAPVKEKLDLAKSDPPGSRKKKRKEGKIKKIRPEGASVEGTSYKDDDKWEDEDVQKGEANPPPFAAAKWVSSSV